MDLVLPSSQPGKLLCEWLPERPARCHRVATSGVDKNAHSGPVCISLGRQHEKGW